VGTSVGLLTPPLLVKRLRANGLADRMSIFMVTTEAGRAQWGEIDGVAGYLTKTFIADGFRLAVSSRRRRSRAAARPPAQR
jgi:hypothetical protein